MSSSEAVGDILVFTYVNRKENTAHDENRKDVYSSSSSSSSSSSNSSSGSSSCSGSFSSSGVDGGFSG